MRKGKFLGLLAVLLCIPGLLTSCKKEEGGDQTPTKESNLAIMKEEDANMINNYTLMAVNPDAQFKATSNLEAGKQQRSTPVNTVGANALINWFLSDEGKTLVKDYGKEKYGETLFTWKDDAPVSSAAKVTIPMATAETKTIEVSTTTSVKDSGLLASILPSFETKYGYEVKIYSKGTGIALANAMYGNADVVLVHSKAQEEAFVTNGYARIVDGFSAARLTFMYNYFVLVGPKTDPAGTKDCASVAAAFQAIADNKCKFISRFDNSGTHNQEVKLWALTNAGITAERTSVADKAWFIAAGAGMGACLTIAEALDGYILSDKATFLSYVKDYAK